MTSLNGVRKLRLTAKETSIANCEVLDENITSLFKKFFVGIIIIIIIIIKASGASLKVTDLLFAFAFCENKPGKLVSFLIGCLLFVNCDS